MALDPKLIQDLFDILGGQSKKPKVTPAKPPAAPTQTPVGAAAKAAASSPPASQSTQTWLQTLAPAQEGPPAAGISQTPKAPVSSPTPAPKPPDPTGGGAYQKDVLQWYAQLAWEGSADEKAAIAKWNSTPISKGMSGSLNQKVVDHIKTLGPPPPGVKPFNVEPPGQSQMTPAQGKTWQKAMLGNKGGTTPTNPVLPPGVTPAMPNHYVPPYQHNVPKTTAAMQMQFAEDARQKRRVGSGFSTPAYRGSHSTKPHFSRYAEPSANYAGGQKSFLASTPELASMYGPNTGKYYLNTSDYHIFNAKGKSWGVIGDTAIDEATKAKKKGIIVINVADEPNLTSNKYGPQTTYVIFDKSTARHESAQFDPMQKVDPKNWKAADLLASGAAIAVGSGLAGVTTDKAGAAPKLPKQLLFHASPEDFEAFSRAHEGKGIGGGEFGKGVYTAENPEVMESYAKAFEEARGKAVRMELEHDSDPTKFINFDSDQQTPFVQAALDKAGITDLPERRQAALERAYRPHDAPEEEHGADFLTHEESEALRKEGVQGVQFMDRYSREGKQAEPTHNYTIFNPDTLKIVKKYGWGALVTGAMAQASPEDAKAAEGQGTDEWLQGLPAANRLGTDEWLGGLQPNQSRETQGKNLTENKGFWAHLLGDDDINVVKSFGQDLGYELKEAGESIKAPFTRKGGNSVKELTGDFMSILGGIMSGVMSPVDAAATTLFGRGAAERETARIKEKIGTPYPGYKFPDQKEAEEAQAHEIGNAVATLLPGMGILPGVGKVPKLASGVLFKKPASPLEAFTAKVGDDLHQLRQTATADKAQITEYVKQDPLVQAANAPFSGKQPKEYLNRVQEIVYHLIENKDVGALSHEDQFFLNDPQNLQAVIQSAKHVAPLRLEASKLYEYLTKIKGVPADELVDPSYVHRRAVGHTPAADPSMQSPNPITGYAGKQKTLPTTTTALQERFYKGAQNKYGDRIVISQDEASGNWMLHEPGQAPHQLKAIDEEHVLHGGDEYTIGNATTKEIEAATPARYYKNALANTADAVQRLRAVARHTEWLDGIKKAPDWKNFATKMGGLAKKNGWREVELPQLRGWYLSPKLAAAFDDFYKPGMFGPENALRKVNQFATASIFWNPTPHVENVMGHWVVGRGWDWLTPSGTKSMFVDGARAIRAVTTQNADYRRMLAAGSGMVFGGVHNANFYQDISRLAGMQIAREPQKWDIIGRSLGLKLSPVEWTRLLYEGSKRTLWWANDVFMMQRVLELERKGMPLAKAVKEAEKHIPNYRIPTEIMGSRAFSQIMQEPALTVFSRYHYGVFRSYANMLRDAFGPTATAKERFDAIGNMMALGILTWVVYPMLDKALQKVTGEPDAHKLRRGPSARIDLLKDLYEGQKNWGQLVSDSITISPATRAGMTLVGGGRDPFTGQPISEPGSTGTEQATQAADWALGQLVQPYQLLGKKPEEEGGRSFGRRIAGQIVGEQDTSEATQRGRRIGQQIEERRARKRRVHPRGFLERQYEGLDE